MVNLSILTLMILCIDAKFIWGWCPDAQVEQDFDTERYLGKWLEIARTEVPYATTNRCNQAIYTANEDGSIGVTNKALEEDNSYTEFNANACCFDGTGECALGCSRWLPGGDYEVLSTDYDKYAIIWSCTNIFWIFHLEYSWILARDAYYDYELALPIVESRTNLKPEDFMLDDNIN